MAVLVLGEFVQNMLPTFTGGPPILKCDNPELDSQK